MRKRTNNNNMRRRSLRSCRETRRAVTMVELVIVIMVMSIMTAVAAPAFFESLMYHRVESAARRVKADLELARHTARLKSTTQSVAFAASAYSLSSAVTGHDDPNEAYTVDLAAAPYELSKVTVNFSNSQAVSFDGYGMPSSGGTVVLTAQGHQCTVTLDGVTGEVSIADSVDETPENVAAVDAP
jgi:Tfp pilus assembly protein FimT